MKRLTEQEVVELRAREMYEAEEDLWDIASCMFDKDIDECTEEELALVRDEYWNYCIECVREEMEI